MTSFALIVAAVLLPENPSAVEKTAAAELEAAFARMGCPASTRTFHVGATAASRRAFGENPGWKYDDRMGDRPPLMGEIS